MMTIPSASTANGGKDEVRILDRGLEVIVGNVGDADGRDLLPLGHARVVRDLPLRQPGTGAGTRLVGTRALRVDLLQ